MLREKRARLFFLADRLSARGGADWHLLGVLDALIADGHAVHLAVGQIDGTAAPPPGVEVTTQAGLEARVPTPVSLQHQLDDVAPELIHVHNVVNPEALEWVVAQQAPALMTVQDHRFFCPGRGKLTAEGDVCKRPMSRDSCASCFDEPGYFGRIFSLTQRRLAAVRQLPLIVLSRYMKRELVAAGVAPTRVHVIPPFVFGLDQEAAPEGPPCVLFVGRLVEAKGADVAVEAWRRSGVDLPLLIAGTGSRRDALLQQLAERGILESRCRLLGWVPHERLSALYRRASVLLMPCRWQEPFGIVGLEAMTLGVPVAAWRSGGVEQWHPGDSLTAWGDLDGLARAARQIAGQRVTAPQGFEKEELMARLYTLYGDLIARGS